jgi:hypothetical protein
MSEREKENQHRWLKMRAKHAAIQDWKRWSSKPTEEDHIQLQQSVGGEPRGRGQKGLLSASVNLTGNADHLNQQRRITSNVNKACGEKRGGGRPEAPSAINQTLVFFWANSGMREETIIIAIQKHFSEHSLKNIEESNQLSHRSTALPNNN